MTKRQMLLEMIQKLPDESLDNVLTMLETAFQQSGNLPQTWETALQEEIEFMKKLPERGIPPYTPRTWKREDLYEQ